jgi:SAM-dependent methyltransferase
MRTAAGGATVPEVTSEFDAAAHNRSAWDREVGTGNEWTVPVSPDVIAAARAGTWSVVLIGYDPVPRDWFPDPLAGTDVLCLASGGGQQAPILAAAGATVTVLDNSPRQLAQDQLVADRDGLELTTVLGDMRDLSAFADASFDVVFNPVSNVFCPALAPVWLECYRVLRPGGELLTGFMNPDVFIFDADASENRDELVVRHALPYSDVTHLSADERERLWGLDAPVEYSHSLTDQIGGQLAAGFVITRFRERPHHVGPTAQYMPGYFATGARKPG